MNRNVLLGVIACAVLVLLSGAWVMYEVCRIQVPEKHIAIFVNKTGRDMTNDMEVAPDATYKGPQRESLSEGRYYINPYSQQFKVIPYFEVPTGKLAVKIRLAGDDLPYGEVIAWEESQKGIVPQVLRAGRYPINPHIEKVELHDPVVVPAGFRAVVTLLAAPMPEDPNVLLVEDGFRGVQKTALEEGTYYFNPYIKRVNLVDCRSQRFNLATVRNSSKKSDFSFPSKDGFPVRLGGILEFRIKPEKAASVFVTYNDVSNKTALTDPLGEEIVKKIIMPNARSFCRLRGSNNPGRDFIGGETRESFQKDFAAAMQKACDEQGVEVIQSLITRIKPPDAIAMPIREREVARQQLAQYTQETLQQASEMEFAKQQELVKQAQELIKVEQAVIEIVTKAEEEQAVAVTKANENLEVSKELLEAAKDEKLAILTRGKGVADVVNFDNAAQAAGWKRACAALGDGKSFARYVFFEKVAPGFDEIMVNTSNSPLMDIFKEYQTPTK